LLPTGLRLALVNVMATGAPTICEKRPDEMSDRVAAGAAPSSFTTSETASDVESSSGVLARLERAFPAIKTIGNAMHGAIPIVHQTTATDCGAACLSMVLAYHGRHASLEELRNAMSIGRDGVTARAIVEAAG